MSDAPSFSLTVEPRDGYRFDVVFDDPSWDPVHTDEPEPLGQGTGPNPVRLLGAAVGNCLAASLQFCLQKSKVDARGVRARVTGTTERNERGRLRIKSIDVVLEPIFDGVPPERFHRCTQLFEDFCIVTQSVRDGIDVDVRVEAVESGDGAEILEPALS